VVDVYNIVSVTSQLPMAAYDLAYVSTPIELRFARNGDKHRGIGQAESESVPTGELVYADQRIVICRSFNYRDADDTKVTTGTKDLVVFVDGSDAVTTEELGDALRAVTARIVEFNGGSLETLSMYPK